MNIVIKHTLKNIFKNPFRSLVLIVCVMVTCLTAYLTLDMSGSIEEMFIAYTADMLGDVDLEIDSGSNIDDSFFADLPECDVFYIAATSNKVATRDPKQYSYEYVQDLSIMGMDIDMARKLDFFKEEFTLTDSDAAISETYAETFGIEIGDTVMLRDEKGEPHDFTVKAILSESGVFIPKDKYTAVVNIEAIKMLRLKDELKYHSLLVNVVDDNQIDTVCNYLEENYPEYTVIRVKGNEDIQEVVGQMVSIFAILFVITFLMVIFVTVSLSEKIVNERMAVIGTLRSLGISAGVTTAILLIENIAYAVLGFMFGTLIYGTIREGFLGSMISVSEGTIPISPMQPWIYVAVLLGAILIECFTPVVELSKAVKIAIRDIIFSNKDTDYKFSDKKTIAGIIMLVLGAIMIIFKNAFLNIVAIIIVVIGVTMIVPKLFRLISNIFAKVFGKANMYIAELAATEMGTKKSTISNSILCLTITALAIALLAAANGLFELADYQSFDSDIIGIGLDTSDKNYKYIESIEGVTEVQFIQNTTDKLIVNGEEMRGYWDIYGLPQGDMFVGIPDLPETLANDECVLCALYADKLGIEVGDTVEFTFKSEYLFPITKNLKVAAITDSALYSSSPLMVLSEDFFQDVYHTAIGGILIRCEDVEIVKDTIDKHSLDQTFLFFTSDEYTERIASEKAGISAAITAAIVIGVVLSIIGISGNQILGFEARRREYAVMYSTSMTRKQISRLIFQETFLSVGTSVILGTILGFILTIFIKRAVYALLIPLPVGLGIGQYVQMAVVLIFIMVVTSLKPIKLLKKMKIAEELKYE